MAFFASRRPNLSTAQHRRRLEIGAILAVGAFVAAGAQAQTIIGGNTEPSVTVDTSVLDQLGPQPTLPRLFHGQQGATHAPASHSATPHQPHVANTALRRHRAHGKSPHKRTATTHHTGVGRSSLDSVIHLTPPEPRVASAKAHPSLDKKADHKTAESKTASASRDSVAARMASLASPVPPPATLPKAPQPGIIPPAPNLPPAPAHVEAPTAPKPAPAPIEAATLTTAAPPPPARTPSPAPAAPVAAAGTTHAAETPGTATTTSTAPPVHRAAATTAGAVASPIRFAPGATDLPAGPQASLDAIAARMLADNNLRVQVIAHATGSADEAMEARRVSLARAVAVRAYLIQKGVHSLRIDVRALGNRAEDGPASDQVDLILVNQ